MIDIPFNETWNSIAISLSGGADSALLAYLLCQKVTNQDVHIISHIRCWKTKPWQEYDSRSVYDYLVDKFPNINFSRHVNFIPPDLEWGSRGPTIIDEYDKLVSGDIIELRSYAEYICHKYDIDIYYNAVTRNPKDVDFVGMHTRDIDPTIDNKHLELMTHMDRLAAHPFRFVQKDKIIAEYRHLDIYDLFELTRSCEGEFKEIDYKTYKPYQYVPICNECFWCKERAWAIEQSK